MDINYNDLYEKMQYFCHECHREVTEPHLDIYCSHCGHKYEPDKVNKIRQKIKKICFEEGH